MSLLFDLLKSYLFHSVMIFLTPAAITKELLSSDHRVVNCLSVSSLLVFIGVSIGYSLSSDNEFTLERTPILFLPLILYIIAIKIAWFATRIKTSSEVLFCQSMMFIGINVIMATTGMAFGLFFLKTYSPKLYAWFYENEIVHIFQSLISHQPTWEKLWDTEVGLRLFVYTTYFFMALSIIYWIALSIGIAKHLDKNWMLGLTSGITSTFLCILFTSALFTLL